MAPSKSEFTSLPFQFVWSKSQLSRQVFDPSPLSYLYLERCKMANANSENDIYLLIALSVACVFI